MDDLFDDLFENDTSEEVSSETAFFVTLDTNLTDKGKHPSLTVTETESFAGLTDEDLLSKLNMLLVCIKTLGDYELLISILQDMKDMLTVRILRIFFEALVPVEQRVWASQGMYPPVADYVDELIDNLLDNYLNFAYGLEERLVNWTKENGFYSDPAKKDFLVRRNKIYAEYIVLAGEFIGDVS